MVAVVKTNQFDWVSREIRLSGASSQILPAFIDLHTDERICHVPVADIREWRLVTVAFGYAWPTSRTRG